MQPPQYPPAPPPHPFARYPYAYPPYQPPRYVGPAWAAPGPPRKLPDRGEALGIVAIMLSITVLSSMVGLIVAAIAAAPRANKRTTDPDSDDNRPAEIDVAPVGSGLPAARGLPSTEDDARAEQTWRTSTCIDKPMKAGDVELRTDYQSYAINRGTAKRMRGHVAVVHLLLASSALTWTMGKSRDVHRSALLTGRFFELQAARYGVTDLEYTPIAWTLPTTFDPPHLTLDSKDRVTSASSKDLVRKALVASEATLGEPMKSVAAALKTEGYSEVAFLLHVPRTAESARDFAYPSPLYSDVDVAIVFDERLDRLGYTTAHETMHLFGADDLYPLAKFDDRDAGDVMRASCIGYGGIQIKDMSAYAIGWTTTRPPRAYGWDTRQY